MTRILHYVGRDSPWRNISAFVELAKKTYPQLKTQAQINELVAVVTEQVSRTHRFTGLHVFIGGRDLLSNDLLSNPAWTLLPPDRCARILNAPEATRRQWMPVEGLSQSYIWCARNGFSQDVTDDDYARIMASPVRKLFWDPEVQGEWTPSPRAYDLFEIDRQPVNSLADGEYLLRDRRPKHLINGADLRE